MFCPHCHNKIPDGSNFCPLCYANLVGVKQQEKESAAETDAPRPKQKPAPRKNNAKPAYTKGSRQSKRAQDKTPMIIAIGLILILVLIMAWNYIKLLFEAAERYVLLGVLVFTAPVAFAMGASQTTSEIFKSWCRMLGGQIFLLIMNAWCLRLFTSMVGTFLSNPLSL